MPPIEDVSQRQCRLTRLKKWQRRRVTYLEEDKAAVIASFGIYPGVLVELSQRRPIYVVRCEDSEIAMDEPLARAIWVEAFES